MTKETEAEKIIKVEKEAADKLEAERETADRVRHKSNKAAQEAAEADKPTKAEDLISAANAAAARQEEANVKHEALLNQQAELKVELSLGGEAEAGTGSKEETPQEYKDRIMKGEEDDKTRI